MTTLELNRVEATRNQLRISWSIGGYSFGTSYLYDSVDLDVLRESLGTEPFNRLMFHIALFEVNKGCNFRPDRIEVHDWDRFLTPGLVALWKLIFRNVWAQWRWENNEPFYEGPEFTSSVSARFDPIPIDAIDGYLAFCGGGKDSLVATELLDLLQFNYQSLAYSHSIYGPSEPQHTLIQQLLDRTKSGRVHRQWTYDDMVDVPVSQIQGVYRPESIIAAETPSSIFGAIPIAITHGINHLILAHERSANIGNVIWSVTGEDVNHQWGKSYEAERAINTYIASELVTNLEYFSILQQIYDPLIFSLLRNRLDAVPYTHSCNIRKPWCMNCPKCAYVWLNYKAWLPWDIVDPMFDHTNLLDLAENQIWFEQMLGLGEHTPFECIGQVHEAKLAFALCEARGLEGNAMNVFRERVRKEDWMAVASASLTVEQDGMGIPLEIATRMLPILQTAAAEALDYVSKVLSHMPVR